MKIILSFSFLLFTCVLQAQFLQAPPSGDNQASTVSQSVSGVATVTVRYNSPDVDGRQGKIWGQLVPYDQVWRVGANENTTITFSADARVEGQAIPAGTYGFFLIPGASSWTVIFSKTHTAWGTFVYDEAEDQLRVQVKPESAEYNEYLTFEFNERKPDYTVLAMKWENLAVPFKIAFPVHELVVESFRAQLKSNIGLFFWEAPNQAAGYCLDHEVFLEQGLAWAEQSVQIKPQFENLMTQSKLLEKLGRPAEAESAKTLAMKLATPNDLYYLARSLQAQKENEQALVIYRQNQERFGDLFITQLGLGRGYSALGDHAAALKHFQQALALADSPRRKENLERLIAQTQKALDSKN